MEFSWYQWNITKIYFWKYFWWTSSFISPIVWVLYLTLSDSTAFQLWIFTTIAFVFGLFLETISGYISDNLWHKNVLLFFSISMILSNIFFIIPFLFNSFQFLFFTLWSIFLAIWLSFKSWSSSAFLYESLEELWREKEFKILSAKISSRVSIFDFMTMLLIPLTIAFSYILPFIICIIFQFIALFICCSFLNPTIFERNLKSKFELRSIIKIIWDLSWSFIVPVSIFSWVIITAIDSSARFRAAFAVDIWLAVEMVWIVAWTVPLFMFIFWFFIFNIEKYLWIKWVLIINFINFSVLFYVLSVLSNPYLFAILVWIVNWFYHITYSIINHEIIQELPDKKYKATVLSLRSQVSMFLMVWWPVLIWFLTNSSFKSWFAYFSIIIFLLLLVPFIRTLKLLKK